MVFLIYLLRFTTEQKFKIMNTIKISLYVGTYHKYNSGSIAGKWVDRTDFTDLTEFYEYCAELHSDEDDPEYMFQDFEAPSLFDNMGLISEGYLSDDIFEAIDLLETADYDVEVYEAFANHFGGSNYDMQELL